jgi:hypothetical protein
VKALSSVCCIFFRSTFNSRVFFHQVVGNCKTEASQKPVPLEASVAEDLWLWKQSSPYNRPEDWVFASPWTKGKQPLWPEDECERSSQHSNDRIEEILRETQRARYAQHLAPCNLLRYETANQRQLYGALHELERLQGLRRGDNVTPKRRFTRRMPA